MDRQACGQTERHVNIRASMLSDRQARRQMDIPRQTDLIYMCKNSPVNMQVSGKGHLDVCMSVCIPEYMSGDASLPTFKYGTDLPDPGCAFSIILS